MAIQFKQLSANGMTFDCRVAGDRGEPVVLLHGFPETSRMWEPLMEKLALAGYRCVAPDQRGYSPGARPEGADNYRLDALASDVIALADAAGFGRFHLVGHDWGAGCGWAVVSAYAGRIASWTALSVPHMEAFANAILHNPEQQQRSTYMAFFQQEGVAESTLSANDFAVLRNIWTESTPDEIEAYLSVLRQSGALTGALNWYRGIGANREGERQPGGDVSTPTLFIWGNQDQAIGREAAEGGHRYMKGSFKFVELDAGHWLIQQCFERVSTEILEHIAAHPAR
jgi:pimeloyl-ACP methyl ester carboxylesterase